MIKERKRNPSKPLKIDKYEKRNNTKGAPPPLHKEHTLTSVDQKGA